MQRSILADGEAQPLFPAMCWLAVSPPVEISSSRTATSPGTPRATWTLAQPARPVGWLFTKFPSHESHEPHQAIKGVQKASCIPASDGRGVCVHVFQAYELKGLPWIHFDRTACR